MKNNEPLEIRPNETARLEAFSDGVFAISITLLVIELIQAFKFTEGEPLVRALYHHIEPFIAFCIGFITILVCWINHHYALNYIKKVDSRFMWINGFLLFMVTITPFPTAILAKTMQTEGQTALALFGVNFILISIGAYGICNYAYKRNLIDLKEKSFFNCVRSIYGYGIIITIINLIVCFLYTPLAVILYILLFSIFAFPTNFANRLYLLKNKKSTIQKK